MVLYFTLLPSYYNKHLSSFGIVAKKCFHNYLKKVIKNFFQITCLWNAGLSIFWLKEDITKDWMQKEISEFRCITCIMVKPDWWDRPSTQNFIRMLPHTHTTKWYEKVYYTHNKTFWGQQGSLSSRSKNGLKKQKQTNK